MQEMIKDVFESIYVHKSCIVCSSKDHEYLCQELLKDLYPVSILKSEGFMETMRRFQNGDTRMLMMSEIMFSVVAKWWPECLEDVTAIFMENDAELHIGTLPLQSKLYFVSSSQSGHGVGTNTVKI